MFMPALKALHRSMLGLGADMQQFLVTTGAASFDCLFSTCETPFVLALTSRGDSPKFFRFDVTEGYSIRPYFDGFYHELAAVLNNGARTGVKLEPKVFLTQLDNAIPTTAKTESIPLPEEIVRLRQDIKEERDRPYFDTWIYWKSEKKQHGPSKENRHKTLMLIGPAALKFSIEMKASSRWSAIFLGRDGPNNLPPINKK